MKQLKISYVTLENGKKENHVAMEIVASTKSQNVLIRDYNAKDRFIRTIEEKDLFVDKIAVETALTATFGKQYSGDVLKALVAHAVKALDGACMFERPKAE